MIRILITTLVISFFGLTSFAQKQVVLQNDGTATVFGGSSAFADAYEAASDGDTLYLPGIQFSGVNNFDKSLTIFGTGYHPEHTEATSITRISGNSTIRAEASGSHFEGLNFTGNVSFASEKIDDITIKRCYIDGDLTLNGLEDNLSENIKISQSIIRGRFNGQRTSNLIFSNNIVFIRTNFMFVNVSNNAWIHNNIIIGRGWYATSFPFYRYMITDIDASLFQNNIIYNVGSSSYTFDHNSINNNSFEYNVFSHNPTTDNNNTWSDNFTDVDIPAMFENYFDENFSFELGFDFNLIESENFQGSTGNQVGIYGGLTPLKYRPANPQILSKDIEGSTDEDGKLGVEIEVEAQEE